MSARSRLPHLPHVSQSPTDPDFFNDPYGFYRDIRAMGDFVYWTDYDMVMATTHQACAAVLKHPKLGRAAIDPAPVREDEKLKHFKALERFSLLELEPPDHGRIRRAAMGGFGRTRIAGLAPDIARIADDLISDFPSGPFDFIEHFAHPYPARIITRFFGLPESMAGALQGWSNDMVAIYQARRSPELDARADASAREFATYLRQVMAGRGSVPQEDFLSELIKAEAEGTLHSLEELLSTVVLLLNAGHEATVHALGHAMNLLADFPERSLALSLENIAATVEECLRFRPPLHMFHRDVYEDVVIEDQPFARGDRIGVLLGSACHDDAIWPDGEHFDPFRPRHSNLSLGSGIHVCIGASLARLEMQIALPAFFSRCPNLRIVEPPKLSDRYHFHGLEKLMVRCS
ncbi:MAG: cytochrome P450 [Silicimonas sp.]|nr:cytochrome P450 [Silicimonas sp.]